MSCKGPHVPQDYLFKTHPNKKIATLVTNEMLSAALAEKNLPKVITKSVLSLSVTGSSKIYMIQLGLWYEQ